MPAPPSGTDWIAGGVVAAVMLPILAIGVGAPFWIACVISALAGGGVVAILAPRKLFSQLDASGAARGKIEFARELLTAAEPLAARIDAAVKSSAPPQVPQLWTPPVRPSRPLFPPPPQDP